jgi:ABC-2 type transport system ATP-binding protein
VKLRRVSVIDDVTFELEKGVTPLLGINGAGKSTLLRALAGAIKSSGSVSFVQVDGSVGSEVRIGFAPQEIAPTRLFAVRDFLVYLAQLDGQTSSQSHARANVCIEMVGLTDESGKKLSELSGGMRKRLSVAQALLNDPDVLLLDEPTAGLDIVQRSSMLALIESLALDRVVLFTTHLDADLYPGSASPLLIHAGKIWRADSPANEFPPGASKLAAALFQVRPE